MKTESSSHTETNFDGNFFVQKMKLPMIAIKSVKYLNDLIGYPKSRSTFESGYLN